MKCPYCNGEMDSGYLTTDALHIAWRKEKYESAVVKKGNNGIQLAQKFQGACNLPAYCCKSCKKIIVEYTE